MFYCFVPYKTCTVIWCTVCTATYCTAQNHKMSKVVWYTALYSAYMSCTTLCIALYAHNMHCTMLQFIAPYDTCTACNMLHCIVPYITRTALCCTALHRTTHVLYHAVPDRTNPDCELQWNSGLEESMNCSKLLDFPP